MSAFDSGRVWCEASVESVTIWIDEDDFSPVVVCQRLLEDSPRFAENAHEEVLQTMIVMVTRGLVLLRSGDVGIYSLSPIRAEGYTWDPEANRLSIRAVSGLWTLADGRLRGNLAPLLYSSVCRRFYQCVLGRIVEADLERRMGEWRDLPPREAEPRISEAILDSFRAMANRFPAERYQTLVRDLSLDGVEAARIYARINREMMDLASRQLRGLQAATRLRA